MPADQQPGADGYQMPEGQEKQMPASGQHGPADEPMPELETDYDPASGMPRAVVPPAGPGVSEAEALQPPVRRRCATAEVDERLAATVPEYAAARTLIERHAEAFLLTEMAAERAGITLIPVVVHVVHHTDAHNISRAQIDSQLEVLNRDFRRTNPDADNTPAPFLPLASDARIRFQLASVDPQGNPTDGITRTRTTQPAFSSNDAMKFTARGGHDAWPANRYLNIWVCQLSGGLLGYAQFPGGPAATDGVVVLHSGFGTTGTAAAPFNLGRTTTHEIGHWLNLRHIWGDVIGCTGSDNVDDTPQHKEPNYGVPAYPHLSCTSTPPGDMFMNYMDYVDDAAMVMFSAGQVARMRACLDGPRTGFGTVEESATGHQGSGPVTSREANRLDVFVTGTTRALHHKYYDGTAWQPSPTGFDFQGGICTSVPQVVSWEADRLDVFVTGTDSALYHKYYDGSAWGPSPTGFEHLGGIIVGDPKAVSWGPNRLDVFVIGTDRALYHKWWDGHAWGPSTTGYERQGGVILGQPEAVSWGPNRLDVFVIGTDRALYHKWWDGNSWGPSLDGYERLGGVCISDARAVSWGENRLDVFVIGTDGALYHKWWDGNSWGPSVTGFERLGGVCISDARAVSWGENRLDVFVIGTDGALYHKWWDGQAWGPSVTGFERLGGVCTSPARAVAWGPDRLDVFVTGTNGALFHKWWDGHAWGPSITGFETLGGVITDF